MQRSDDAGPVGGRTPDRASEEREAPGAVTPGCTREKGVRPKVIALSCFAAACAAEARAEATETNTVIRDRHPWGTPLGDARVGLAVAPVVLAVGHSHPMANHTGGKTKESRPVAVALLRAWDASTQTEQVQALGMDTGTAEHLQAVRGDLQRWEPPRR